jgi:hypothetical protein
MHKNTISPFYCTLMGLIPFFPFVACNQANDKACNDAVLALIADHFTGERR